MIYIDRDGILKFNLVTNIFFNMSLIITSNPTYSKIITDRYLYEIFFYSWHLITLHIAVVAFVFWQAFLNIYKPIEIKRLFYFNRLINTTILKVLFQT